MGKIVTRKEKKERHVSKLEKGEKKKKGGTGVGNIWR